METNEKITYLGYLEKEDNFYNFYPQYILEGSKLRPFRDEDNYIYHQNYIYKVNLNIGKTKFDKDESKYSNYYHNILPEYGNKVCYVSFSYDDICHEDKKNGTVQGRLSVTALIESNSISVAEDHAHSLYRVTTTPEVLEDSWYFPQEAREISVYDELEIDRNYCLEYKGSFIGPLTYGHIRKRGLFLPKTFEAYSTDKCIEISFKNSYRITEVIKFVEKASLKPMETIDDSKPIEKKSDEAHDDSEKSGKETEKVIIVPPAETDETEEKRKSLVESINSYREYGNNMICNMLICITQGLLTVFSGAPGTGKTSICDKIAERLGVSNKNDKQNRYLSISVERGWTSKNDLIGYYNPLDNGVMDATGLYKALQLVDKEKREEGSYAPYLVLLDEANLSQMEYYWSNFIKLADDDARRKTPLYFGKKKDDKGQEEKMEFMIPDWFKFLATINNDQTTESLSPRLLDRAWVITLPTPDNILVENNQDETEVERISWSDLWDMFGGLTPDEALLKESMEKLNTIYEIYSKNGKPVSPRSKIAIEKYLNSALSCFVGKEKGVEAIDYILLQRLLPMLGGYISNEFKDELAEAINVYPKASARFTEMCEDQNFNKSTYVNFFM